MDNYLIWNYIEHIYRCSLVSLVRCVGSRKLLLLLRKKSCRYLKSWWKNRIHPTVNSTRRNNYKKNEEEKDRKMWCCKNLVDVNAQKYNSKKKTN